jgi:restriction system protein
MGRRRDEGFLDTLIRLPWPAGIAFGVLAFVVFRWGLGWYFSSGKGMFNQSIGKALANGGLEPVAWMFLFLGLIAAAVSAYRSRDRAQLLDQQTGLNSLRALSWSRFEQLVGEAYRRQGYSVEETGQGGADGGVDILLRKDGTTTLVQCKHWRTRQIGVSVVREMFGLMHHHQAAAVKIVCTGVFSGDCYRFAVGKPLELVDGAALLEVIGRLQPMPVEGVSVAHPSVPRELPKVAPSCPRCAAQMVERINRASGKGFWGCTSYPRCKGTVAS